jgi:hypothetical protein
MRIDRIQKTAPAVPQAGGCKCGACTLKSADFNEMARAF